MPALFDNMQLAASCLIQDQACYIRADLEYETSTQETLEDCCRTCHKQDVQVVNGEIATGCVWQWCRMPDGCQTANGTVLQKTCMTSRQESFPMDWQDGTMVSGLHLLPGADGFFFF
ncbi:hypothetical protein WJX81_002606 [Elliptochloris bilobata]|uniref:Uncharacterized protein n=1 Tax=Elliptochloris bilobata TaxID=381761 RepID=A0AAW1RKB2_9CHLO